jgi:membrane-associated protein
MDEIIHILKGLMDIHQLREWVDMYGGLYLVTLIIFAETGLFVGFFLPGDSLLFMAGVIIADSHVPFASGAINLIYWIALMATAGVIGNSVGYWFGRKTGPLLFERKDTLLFKRKHVIQAREFYDKKGGGAIILARFLPIVRTFAPIVAGVVEMDRKKFFFFNVVGSLAWISSMILSGYFLGKIPWVEHNFEKIVIGLIVVTTAPVLFKMFFSKKKPILDVAEDIVEDQFTDTKK